MSTFRPGDQITVISPLSRNHGRSGIFVAFTKNPGIATVMFDDLKTVNFRLASIAPKTWIQEIHFYASVRRAIPDLLTDHSATRNAIRQSLSVIRTTQMDFLSTKLYIQGYQLFLHADDLNVTEFRIGAPIGAHKALRPSDDLYQLWRQTQCE